jgi:hypothetical protein
LYLIAGAFDRHQEQSLEEEFGHSTVSMRRARARRFYYSKSCQVPVSFFIVLGFILDMLEAQYRPAEGSATKTWLYIAEVTMTAVFSAELVSAIQKVIPFLAIMI